MTDDYDWNNDKVKNSYFRNIFQIVKLRRSSAFKNDFFSFLFSPRGSKIVPMHRRVFIQTNIRHFMKNLSVFNLEFDKSSK